MGFVFSRDKNRRENNEKRLHEIPKMVNLNLALESESKFDEKVVKHLLNELSENPEIFVLNQLLMSVMFFENYRMTQEEQKQKHTTTKLEKELNPKLLSEESFECIIPDLMFEEVSKNVKFREKDKIEPIVPKRLFVINDNIEVLESDDVPNYTSIDKPNYLGVLEEIVPKEDDKIEKKGFVKIRVISQYSNANVAVRFEHAEPQPGPSGINTVSHDYDSDDDRDKDEVTFIEQQFQQTKKPKKQEDEYGYTKITEAKTPKPLEPSDRNNFDRRNTLPETCFIIKKIPKLTNTGDESDSEEEYYGKEELYEEICYISSEGFMDNFKNSIFPNSLGKSLGFDRDSITQASAIPAVIFCNLQITDGSPVPCQVVPSVSIPWPSKLTLNFETRPDRPTISDMRTGVRYRWPTNDMIAEVKVTNCVLIPKGFMPKRGKNLDMDIEWEYTFPKAERYIDTRMSHAQMRCFLILLVIYKTYIEPETSNHGLLVEHIRNHMYWEVEANYKDWPEHKLGIKILKVISNLVDRLASGIMHDYFIPEKNIFENIPNKHLRLAQKMFHDVLQAPVPKILFALKNLVYVKEGFYSAINFKTLYPILKATGIKSLNPNYEKNLAPNLKSRERKKTITVEGDTNYKREVYWRYKAERKNREKVMAKREQQKMTAEKSKIEEIKKKINVIDDEWTFENSLNMVKIREITLFYLTHFIQMGKQSRMLGVKQQALFYLKQAFYLCRILEEKHQSYDAEKYKTIIRDEEELCFRSQNKSDDPPLTPVRNNSMQLPFVQKPNLRKNTSVKIVTVETSRNNVTYI